ncbi:hypothetical protein PAAG_03778 [Paracoccidioides lutzii Pb01]|uniref:Uncharacterized protein n=1 Tax=Paracoccidioides lutzii (strain ATCC MYA-826 / Pb01) TaxID=502779 RepID=C1GZ34_PARBA|nr:hypothetical protein PAAG_03778 [Paracoccidioides lutzii Pb01]EEH41857.2 hypothetical protein PAAG_03778 [Paracoccidioides lutzii Pb01]
MPLPGIIRDILLSSIRGNAISVLTPPALANEQVPLTDLNSPARAQRLHGFENEEEERSLWSAQPWQNHAASTLPFT